MCLFGSFVLVFFPVKFAIIHSDSINTENTTSNFSRLKLNATKQSQLRYSVWRNVLIFLPRDVNILWHHINPFSCFILQPKIEEQRPLWGFLRRGRHSSAAFKLASKTWGLFASLFRQFTTQMRQEWLLQLPFLVPSDCVCLSLSCLMNNILRGLLNYENSILWGGKMTWNHPAVWVMTGRFPLEYNYVSPSF